MKICNKCLKQKEENGFRKLRNEKYRSVCKGCETEYFQKRYKKNSVSLLEKDKVYRIKNKESLQEKRRERTGAKKRTGVDKDKLRKKYQKQNRIYRERYPYKIQAQKIVREHLMKNLLVKPDRCQMCKESKKVEAHHEDYNKPTEVVWVCRQCHVKLHRGFINE